MPLRIVRSTTNARLWADCLENWLGALGDGTGPDPHAARLWIAHRLQRDAALEAASELGIPGWFDPPIHFLSELRELFRIRARPIGILTGRLLLARLAGQHGGRVGLGPGPGDGGPARSHMLDGVVGELLAEDVAPERLAAALEDPDRDDFTRRRDRWIVDTYRAFLEALEARDLYDARQIHALVARRIDGGGLPEALGGARELHVYGVTSLARRGRLMEALARQAEVDVSAYVVAEPEASEWEEIAASVVDLEGPPPSPPTVVPAPDSIREAIHVARRVKRLVAEEGCRPVDIAVVARSGREDTARIHAALREAGVPSSARLRSPLAEVPALRALLGLFGAVADGWDYRGLRFVATSPYLGVDLDPRPLDYLAAERRLRGLEHWRRALADLARGLERAGARRARRLRGAGLFADRIVRAEAAVAELAARTETLTAPRSEVGWIEATRTFTGGDAFGFRRRSCRVVGERFDVVRLDQRGLRAVDGLLAEWRELVTERETFGPGEWRDRLRRLLEANELALSTPMQRGVQVLEAHEAALTPFAHVFLVHANDGEFPRPPRGGGVLGEGDRARLRAAGLPVEDRATVLRRERALWRSVTAAPAVTLTYRTATASGVPLLPSLMVPGHDPGSALPRTVVHEAGEEDPVSPAEQLRQDVLRLGRRRRGGDAAPLETADPHAVRHAVLGAFADELRSGRLDDVAGVAGLLGLEPAPLLGRDRPPSERAHAWGGRIRDPAVRAVLGERFGPDRVWSASQLQQYAVRPFDFLLERVLRIELRGEAEEETTPLASGTVVHAALEALHRRLLDATPEAFEAGPDLLDEVCEEVFAASEREAELWLGLPALWQLKREHLRGVLAEFVQWDFEQLRRGRFRPVEVEVRFGGDGEAPVELRGRDRAGSDAALRLAGRIDRVDRSLRASGSLRIVDYKLGDPPSPRGYEDGALLQSALYMRVWEAVSGERPAEGVFHSVRTPGRGSRSGLKQADVEDVVRFAFSIPGRVRAGLFEAVQAASAGDPSPWQPGIEVTRTAARVAAGSRFEEALDA